MIQQEYKTITVHTDSMGERLCLRIEESENIGGILNLLWMNEKETEKLIRELQKNKEKLTEKRLRIEEILKTANFSKMYKEFEEKYNPYPVQMTASEAFGKAYADGLIDQDTYHAAHKYYWRIWNYTGD